MSKSKKSDNQGDENQLLSSFDDDNMFGVGNVASTINSQFGMGLDFDTKDFNTEHAQDAVDFEDISLTDESETGDNDKKIDERREIEDKQNIQQPQSPGLNEDVKINDHIITDSVGELGSIDFNGLSNDDNNNLHGFDSANLDFNLNLSLPNAGNNNLFDFNLSGIQTSELKDDPFSSALMSNNSHLFDGLFDNNNTEATNNNFVDNSIIGSQFNFPQVQLQHQDQEQQQQQQQQKSKIQLALPQKPTLSEEQIKRNEEIKKRAEAEKQRRLKAKADLEEQQLRYYYPLFKKYSILKMHTIFRLNPKKSTYTNYFAEHAFEGTNKSLIPTKLKIEFENDEKKLFNKKRVANSASVHGLGTAPAVKNYQKIINITDDDYEFFRDRSQKQIRSSTDDNANDTWLATADWDDDVLLGNVAAPPVTNRVLKNLEISKGLNAAKLYQYDEPHIDNDYEEAIFEGNVAFISKANLKLDMNDPNLLFALRNNSSRSRRGKVTAALPTNEKFLIARFNISNDKAYEILKENYHTKIRATLGNLIIDHSMPAIRLQSPYYKVKLTKQQTRSFHRPKFIVRSNTVMYFSKPKLRKKKKDKGKDIKEIYGKTTDLTLGDTAPFYLLEYTEENPLILSNFGMGSKIINYYRKKHEEDTYRPKGLIGETHVLGVQDRSPFWNFGFVEKGKFVPTLYNQMVRAPVFQHDAQSTDFLLLKSVGGSRTSTRYFLRSIGKIFLVGQLYPVVEVPGPHSRKVTTVSKNRLKMIVYRVLNHNEHKRLVVKDISAHFPDQNDMQNRQRLKEFMVYQRSGEDQGYWKIKPNEKLPNEEEVKAMITPEDLCLLESMQVGQQHLEDYSIYSYDNINLDKFVPFVSKFNNKTEITGFSNAGSPMAFPTDATTPGGKGKSPAVNGNNSGNSNSNKTDLENLTGEQFEEQLAPWNTTRNFINATQGKAMLQLHGEGEPTGRSEGISFLRTSMKGGFKSLEDKDKSAKSGGHSYNVALQQKAYDDEIKRTWRKQNESLSSDEPLEYKKELVQKCRYNNRSLKSSVPPKVLRITRMVRNQYGVLERQVEVIKDERVINAYLLRKSQRYQEELQSKSQQLSQSIDLSTVKTPTNEDEKKLLEQELEKLQAQKNNRKVLQSGKGIGKGRNTKRKCALCGAVGHIRTKKSCPMYGKVPLPPNASGGSLNVSSPGPAASP